MSDGAPRIRLAHRGDADVLRALKENVVDTTWGRDYATAAIEAWKARFTAPTYFAERLAPAPGQALTRFFIAGPTAMPFGMVALKVRDNRAYVGDLYVRVRGRGVGRQLLRYAEAQGAALGLTVAVADVFAANKPAYELLLSDGFHEEDEYIEQSLGIRVIRLARLLTLHQRAA